MKKQKQGGKKSSVTTPMKKKRRGHPQTNPKSLANLKPPWKPGIPSPNPGGRPKLLSEAYREYLAAINPETGFTNAQAIAAAQGLQASLGETNAAKELRQATEGDILNFKNLSDDGIAKLISELERITNPGTSTPGTSAPPSGPDQPAVPQPGN